MQNDQNIIKMYTKQFGQPTNTLELIHEINLSSNEEESGLHIFKIHAGQLYLKNQEKHIYVISLDPEGGYKTVWKYDGLA